MGTARSRAAADRVSNPKMRAVKVMGMNGAAQDVLRLPGALDLAAAEGFLETIRQHLKLDRALCLDASEVETLTLPCIQIILAAVTAYEVSIVNPSAAFASAFHDLALDWTEPIDHLFIDTSHRYAPTTEELRKYEPFVVPGGVMTLHDTTSYPAVWRAVEEVVGGRSDLRVFRYYHNNGLAVIEKRRIDSR